MNVENKILEEIEKEWIQYSKDIPTIDEEIVSQYVNILMFYDSLFPDISKDEISHYNIVKTIILTHKKDEIINELRESEYETKVADEYKKRKELIKK